MPVSRRRKTKRAKETSPKSTTAAMNQRKEVRIQDDHNNGSRQITGKFYQGVIPSPEMMKEYKEVDPDLPNRLVSIVEDEAIHRRKTESRIVRNGFWSKILNNFFGFMALIAMAVLSYRYMIKGYPKEGAWIAAGIATVIGVFVVRNAVSGKKDKDS